MFCCFHSNNQVIVNNNQLSDTLAEKEKAIIKIQAFWRGIQVRKDYLSPRIYGDYSRICKIGDFSAMERAPHGKTKVYLPKEIPSIVIKLTGREKALFRISQMERIKKIIKKEDCKLIIVPKVALCLEYLIEERISIPKSEKECVELYRVNQEKFSDAVKEIVRIYANTFIEYLVDMRISGQDQKPCIWRVRYDNIIPLIDNGIGKIALIDLERNKETSKASDTRKLYRLANIFPRHLEEIKSEGRKLSMQFNEEEVNYGAKLGLQYHRLIQFKANKRNVEAGVK